MAFNPCSLTAGIALPKCGTLLNTAGISNIYLMPAANIDPTKYEINLQGYGVINALSASTDWFEVEVLPETAFYEQKLVKDEKTGANYYEQTITFSIIRQSVFAGLFLTQLLNTNQVVAILKLNSAISWFLFGKENFLTVSEATLSSGTALSDFHGVTITLTGKEKFPAYGVNPNAFVVSSTKYPS